MKPRRPENRGNGRTHVVIPSRFLGPLIATLAICILAAATSTVGVQRTGRSGESDILAGTIDIHVHADPDSAPRVMDGLEIAALARSKGCVASF